MGQAPQFALNVFAIPTFIVGLAALLLGFAVLHRGRGSRTSLLFLITTIPISIWLFTFSIMYCATNPQLALWWAKAGYLGVPMIPAAVYQFTTAVLKLNGRYHRSIRLSWLIFGAISLVALTTDLLIPRVRHFWWGYYPQYGALSVPFITAFFVLMLASLRLYLVAYQKSKPSSTQRQRAGTFLLAFSILNLGAVDYVAKHGIALYPFGYLPVFCFLVICIRAVWRYDLMDLTPTFAAADILKTMGEALLVLDHEGIIRVVNQTACQLLKQPEYDLVGTPLADVNRRLVSAQTQSALMNGAAAQHYEVRIREDSAVRVLEVSASALHAGASEYAGVVCVVKDITERKRMLRALRMSESRFARLAQSNIIGIIVVDLYGLVLEANDAFLQMMGYTRGELNQRCIRWDQMTPADQLSLNQRAIEEVRACGVATVREREYYRKDGTRIPVVVGAALLDGSRDRCICFVLDNTYRKLAEQKLLLLNETLEQKVAERSAAAEQRSRDLIHANQELDLVTQELRATNAKLQELSLLDPLTELLNRRGFQQALTQELEHMRRESTTLTALLVDIDDFKQINDRLGYTVGDVVIQEIAHQLKSCLRVTDHIARIGGDEFLVLLPDLRMAEAMGVAQKVRLSISGSPLWIGTGNAVPVTASLGLVNVDAKLTGIDALIAETHSMLRYSKNNGKNRISCKSDTEKQRANKGRAGSPLISDRLSRLRENRAVRTVIQPIVRLKDRQPVGFELLSRFSLGSFEMPEDVFRMSIEANLLSVVDRQCFEACVDAAAVLPDNFRRHVNLFPSTVTSVPAQELLHLLAQQQRGQFCIELSEQQILGESAHLTEAISALKRSGVLIAIDNVGFGRSSLESLILFEPDMIKIDKRCVQGVAHDPARARSLMRLLKVAGALGTEVIAEGIENQEDYELLRACEVPYGQGFFFGLPAELPVIIPCNV